MTEAADRMRYGDPPFDPFGDRGETHYHPLNAPATNLHQTWLIWRDLQVLLALISASSDPYAKKLLLKYVAVELVALHSHIQQLNASAEKHLVHHPDSAVLAVLREASKRYFNAYKAYGNDLTTIRNKIAAHRQEDEGVVSLAATADVWDLVSERKTNAVLAAAPPLLERVQKVRMFEWTKTGADGTRAFIGPLFT